MTLHNPRGEGDPLVSKPVNVPGTSCLAILTRPFRLVIVLLLWGPLYLILLLLVVLRALFLRCCKGRPSQILQKGTHGAHHAPGMHYGNLQVYKDSLDETRYRKALVELCAEDGIDEKDIELKFLDEKPNDWPETGSFYIDHFIESLKKPDKPGEYHYADYGEAQAEKKKIRIHVWNNDPGKPTVVYYYGSAMAWDGSSNYNFNKELMNRYMENPPTEVFQKPDLKPGSIAKFDQASFLCFFLKIPFMLARNLFMILWNVMRAQRCFGGNGFGFKFIAMNFTEEESNRLYGGCKVAGISPFAAFTFAGVKACEEVLGQRPLGLTQQSSLQTRHYPISNQASDMRDLVGDWLFGVVQKVPSVYGFREAEAGYKELNRELEEIGPETQQAILAKAYGLFNSGAAVFEVVPTYLSWCHPLDRTIFMNNYGLRTMPKGSPFHWWNWNAPLWFGINTINVDGCTTTLVGSCFWGQQVVEKMRDNIEATLRNEFMSRSLAGSKVPVYRKKGGVSA